MDAEGEQRRDQRAANADGGADQRHGKGAPADEPGVGQNHRRMHEAGGKRQRDDAEIDDEKAVIAFNRREQHVTDAGQDNSGQDHRARTEAVDQIAGQRTFDSPFGAGQGKDERGSRATQPQFLSDG